MLPNESLLQVLHFADYATLVLAKLAGARFLHVVTKFAEELARHRRLGVTVDGTSVRYWDTTTTVGDIGYERGNQASLAAACRELAEVIGPHAVAEMILCGNARSMLGVDVIFDAAPPLKYTEDVVLSIPLLGSAIRRNFKAFMSNSVGMKTLRLWLVDDDLRQFSWTFLRAESARELRLIKFTSFRAKFWTENMNRSAAELLRYCATQERPLGDEPLELDFSDSRFPGALVLITQIIQLLKGSAREVTFRMRLYEGQKLVLDESEYTVDVDDATKRYTLREGGIVVEVKGESIVIRSTGEVPPMKRRRRNE